MELEILHCPGKIEGRKPGKELSQSVTEQEGCSSTQYQGRPIPCQEGDIILGALPARLGNNPGITP